VPNGVAASNSRFPPALVLGAGDEAMLAFRFFQYGHADLNDPPPRSVRGRNGGTAAGPGEVWRIFLPVLKKLA